MKKSASVDQFLDNIGSSLVKQFNRQTKSQRNKKQLHNEMQTDIQSDQIRVKDPKQIKTFFNQAYQGRN